LDSKLEVGTDEEMELLLGDSPNTYTFSKALAEALVVEKMGTVPAIIVRPSVGTALVVESKRV
jgi:hypothetical protein